MKGIFIGMILLNGCGTVQEFHYWNDLGKLKGVVCTNDTNTTCGGIKKDDNGNIIDPLLSYYEACQMGGLIFLPTPECDLVVHELNHIAKETN
jgi:hypothetical protein